MPILDLKAALNSEVLIGCGQKDIPWKLLFLDQGVGKGTPYGLLRAGDIPLCFYVTPSFLATAPRQHCGGRGDGYPVMEI